MTRGAPATAGRVRLPVAALVTRWWPTSVVALLGVLVVLYLVLASPLTALADPVVPVVPTPTPTAGSGAVSITIGGPNGAPSTSVMVLIGITLLSVAPALLLMMSSFTKIFVVLAMTRNALGLPTIPPNQVLAGLALFLSLFVMSPVMSKVNHDGIQPYLQGTKTQSQAATDGVQPLRTFMLKQTRGPELQNMVEMSKQDKPKTPADVPLTTLIPAFVLSELKSAFIIGFVIFVPFLVIDLVVSSSLMSMGMMMLPPVLISLPFKLLLFVMIDGWDLITRSLVASYS